MIIFHHMPTMNISLTAELKRFVDSQVAEGGYTSGSEYVRDLLRKERERVRLRVLLKAGAGSPLGDEPLDAEYFVK